MIGVEDPCPLKDTLTYEQKVSLYRAGHYQVNPPPVHHTYWGMDSWIRWIDRSGRWCPPKEKAA